MFTSDTRVYPAAVAFIFTAVSHIVPVIPPVSTMYFTCMPLTVTGMMILLWTNSYGIVSHTLLLICAIVDTPFVSKRIKAMVSVCHVIRPVLFFLISNFLFSIVGSDGQIYSFLVFQFRNAVDNTFAEIVFS